MTRHPRRCASAPAPALLARTQTGLVVDAARPARSRSCTIVTEGDRSSAALDQIGGTGVFVSALREALLAGEIDVAVHSYKDLPTAAGRRHRRWRRCRGARIRATRSSPATG